VTWAFTIGQFEVRKPAMILHMVPIECLSPAHISCQCEQANALVGEHSHLCWSPARGCSMSAGSIGFAESLSIRFPASWCGRPGSCNDMQSLDGPIAKGSPLRLQGRCGCKAMHSEGERTGVKDALAIGRRGPSRIRQALPSVRPAPSWGSAPLKRLCLAILFKKTPRSVDSKSHNKPLSRPKRISG
jgi:hypothetical protein